MQLVCRSGQTWPVAPLICFSFFFLTKIFLFAFGWYCNFWFLSVSLWALWRNICTLCLCTKVYRKLDFFLPFRYLRKDRFKVVFVYGGVWKMENWFIYLFIFGFEKFFWNDLFVVYTCARRSMHWYAHNKKILVLEYAHLSLKVGAEDFN